VVSLVNTAIGRVFAAYLSKESMTDMLALEPLRLAGSPAQSGLKDARRESMSFVDPSLFALIRREGIDRALGAPIPGIDALAAPVFDHTNTVRLVIALMGSTGTFDSSGTAMPAQRLLRATRQLSWRLGWAPAGHAAM
jgi:DNA-binding IclR family transcriptional regulator